MNKKIINKVLIIVVLVIWGILLFKIFGKKTKEIPKVVTVKNNVYPNKQKIIKDTFELEELLRDPFLGKIKKVRKKIIKPLIKNKITSNKKKTIKWPVIQYFGFVKGEHSKRPLLLLKINGKFYKERLFSDIEGVYLKKVNEDTLVVSYSKKEKIIIKH